MFWTLYEIFLNLFQGFLFTWFITRMLKKKKPDYVSSVICALLTAAAFSSYLVFPMPAWDTWVFIFIILYALIFFEGQLLHKVFWLMILITVSLGVIEVSYQIFSMFAGTDTEEMLSSGFTRIVFTLLANFLIWLGLFTITRIFREESENIKPPYLLLITVLLCLFLIDVFFILRNRFELPMNWLFLGCILSLAIAAVTLVTYNLLARYEKEKQTLHFQEEKLKGEQNQAQELQQIYSSMLQLRHDTRSFVQDVKGMIERGQLQEEPAYLRELEAQVMPLYSSGNQALDSVLSVKLNKLRSCGIELRGSNLHYTGGMNITDYDLCSLVSNMLDNAVEALNDRRDRPGERYIYLKFAYTPAGLVIICENPLLGVPPKMQRTSFFSQKYEPYHGLGLSIMKHIADEAGGTFEAAVSEDLFRVLAIIPPADRDQTEALNEG